MHQQLHEREADQIARFQAQYAQQRQHVERVDQVRQRFGGIVDLHRPAQVVFQVVGHLHHVRRFDDPLAATRRNEEAKDRRVHAHQQRIGVVGGDAGEEGRDVVRDGLRVTALDRGQQRGDGAIQRELDQHAGGGRHRTGHGVQEAARAPVQQRADHDEQEVVGVKARNRGDRRLGAELVVQPAGGQHDHQDDQQRAVFQPLAGTGARRQRRQAERRIDATFLGVTGVGRAGRGGVGDDDRDHHQRQQHDARLPEEDGLGEGDHPSDRQNRWRQARRVGLQLRRRRRQTQCPHGAQAQIGCGTGGAVVHFEVRAARQCTHQQTTEYQRQAPVEQGGDHGNQRHPGDRRATVFRDTRQTVDQLDRRRRTGDHVAADDHEGHLHGERDQAPEAVAKGFGGVGGFGADGQGGEGHDHHGQGGEHPGVREPALGPLGAAQGKSGGAAFFDIGGHVVLPLGVIVKVRVE